MAAEELEAQADGAQVLAEGDDADHVGAHDGRRQLIADGAVGVVVSLEELQWFG